MPILTIMNLLKGKIILCIDASDLANGVVLMQGKQVVVYEFCKLNLVELNNPIYEKELLILIQDLKVWRHYLLRVKFNIETYYKSLKYL